MKRNRAFWFAGAALVVAFAEPAYWQIKSIPTGMTLEREEAAIQSRCLRTVSKLRKTCPAPPECSVPVWAGFCVEVADHDPTPAVLRDLATLPAPAKPASRCVIQESVHSRRLPPDHLLLWVKKPVWVSGGLVQIEAGDYLGSLAATGYRITVLRAWGRWWAVWRRLEWIS